MRAKSIVYHAPSTENGKGYFTLTFGKKWADKRKKRMAMQKQSRKANRP